MIANHRCRFADYETAGFRGAGNVRQGCGGALLRRRSARDGCIGRHRLARSRSGCEDTRRSSFQPHLASAGLDRFGSTLAARAARLLADAEDAENAALELASKPGGLIRLAVQMSFGLVGSRQSCPISSNSIKMFRSTCISPTPSSICSARVLLQHSATPYTEVCAGRQGALRHCTVHRRCARLFGPLRRSATPARARSAPLPGLCLSIPAGCLALLECQRRGRG